MATQPPDDTGPIGIVILLALMLALMLLSEWAGGPVIPPDLYDPYN